MEPIMRRRPPRVDIVLAAALAAVAEFEVFASNVAGSKAVLATAALLMTLPLAWRRLAPVTVVLAVSAVVVAESLLERSRPVPQASFLVLLLAAWTCGAHGGRRTGLLGCAATIIAGCVWTSLDKHPKASDYIFIAFILAAAWVAGRFFGERHLYAKAVEDRAASLEREQEANARATLAEERTRIARELHDIVAHSISVMVVQAGVERQLLDEEHESTRNVLDSIEQTGKAALTEMRRVLGLLRPNEDGLDLAPPASVAHLDALAQRMSAAGLPVHVRVEGDETALPPGVDLSAYRIVQEALTNTLKHAHATTAEVVLRYGDDALEVEVVDDGRGGSPPNGSGHGLLGMRERAALVGGVVQTGRLDGGGFLVRARLPLAQA